MRNVKELRPNWVDGKRNTRVGANKETIKGEGIVSPSGQEEYLRLKMGHKIVWTHNVKRLFLFVIVIFESAKHKTISNPGHLFTSHNDTSTPHRTHRKYTIRFKSNTQTSQFVSHSPYLYSPLLNTLITDKFLLPLLIVFRLFNDFWICILPPSI